MDRGVDPIKAPLTEVTEFLENLRTIRHKGNPLAPSTFAGYRSARYIVHSYQTPSGHGEGSLCYLERAIQEGFQGYCRWLGKGGHLWGVLALVARAERADGHSCSNTRGVATTWAATVGVLFEDIMDAAACSRPQTFARFYLKDLPAMRGRFSRAGMVAAVTAARK